MKIILERENCIGCGSCVSACPDHWEMADDGKVDLIDHDTEEDGRQIKEVEEVGCNEEAAEVCPTQVIKVEK